MNEELLTKEEIAALLTGNLPEKTYVSTPSTPSLKPSSISIVDVAADALLHAIRSSPGDIVISKGQPSSPLDGDDVTPLDSFVEGGLVLVIHLFGAFPMPIMLAFSSDDNARSRYTLLEDRSYPPVEMSIIDMIDRFTTAVCQALSDEWHTDVTATLAPHHPDDTQKGGHSSVAGLSSTYRFQRVRSRRLLVEIRGETMQVHLAVPADLNPGPEK